MNRLFISAVCFLLSAACALAQGRQTLTRPVLVTPMDANRQAITNAGTIISTNLVGHAAGISNVPAASIIGTNDLPDGVLSTNVPLAIRTNSGGIEYRGIFLGDDKTGAIWLHDAANDVYHRMAIADGWWDFSTVDVRANSFDGVGSTLSELNASALTLGTVPDARLASNVMRFTGGLTVQTNSTLKGTNWFPAGSTIGFERYEMTTLAAGANAAVPLGTNVWIELSGNSGAATLAGLDGQPNRPGDTRIILYRGATSLTVAHNSGLEPVAANRITTISGRDHTSDGPCALIVAYSGGQSRWQMIGWLPALDAALRATSVVQTNGADSVTIAEGDVTASGNITASGTVTAGAFIGDGSQLTGVSGSAGAATNVVWPGAGYGLTSTTNALVVTLTANTNTLATRAYAESLTNGFGTGSGSPTTNAAELTTGTLDDDRLSANVPLLNAASNHFSGDVGVGGDWYADTMQVGSIASSNAALNLLNSTNFAASNLVGTLPDSAFPAVLPAVDGSHLTGIAGGVATNVVWPVAGTNVTATTNGNAVTISTAPQNPAALTNNDTRDVVFLGDVVGIAGRLEMGDLIINDPNGMIAGTQMDIDTTAGILSWANTIKVGWYLQPSLVIDTNGIAAGLLRMNTNSEGAWVWQFSDAGTWDATILTIDPTAGTIAAGSGASFTGSFNGTHIGSGYSLTDIPQRNITRTNDLTMTTTIALAYPFASQLLTMADNVSVTGYTWAGTNTVFGTLTATNSSGATKTLTLPAGTVTTTGSRTIYVTNLLELNVKISGLSTSAWASAVW